MFLKNSFNNSNSTLTRVFYKITGEVELENVPLRKDALRHFDIPFEVRAGFIGKVKLQIPVTRLRSEPWVILFDQLYLVAGPLRLDEVSFILFIT